LVVLLLIFNSGGIGPGGSGATSPQRLAASLAHPLPVPISGEVVLPQAGKLLVVGGLDGAGASASGIFRLDPQTGQLGSAGVLAQPLHDAAGATLGSRVLVFGGGAVTSTDAVESFGPGQAALPVGHLPTARSDLNALAAGGRAYVFGGYDGHTPSPAVLATSDGQRFSQVARLPVPVRYPAAAALGNTIYVFGGELANGQGTTDIQAIDVATGRAKVIGHLPRALAHASAVVLDRRIYVLGGSVGGTATDAIVGFDPASMSTTPAGHLPIAVSNSAAATLGGVSYLVGGIGLHGAPLADVVSLRLAKPAKPPPPAPRAGAGAGVFPGDLLIADRGNNRLLLVNPQKKLLWSYPGPGRPAPVGGFYFPDDAFFTHHGSSIISNEEQNETIVQIAFPSGKVTWSYGHPRTAGSAPGFLHEPDDAYLLKDGTITVADAQNCRILFLGPHDRPVSQIGTTGSCVHNPPQSLGSPNGDTPLANGDVLVSEVNGSYVDELTPNGKLIWSLQLPISYPSDPQQLGPDRYLIADYSRPGGIYEFDRSGKILWSYHPASGNGMLDHPSLAERLPNGLIATNDDYRDRVVLINPKTKRIVWQYGRTDRPGTGPDHLKTPDGFDLLEPGGVTPTHPFTG
jgi:outer membrane protein assembly factor BamB